MEQFETKARARVTEYTASLLTIIASYLFFTAVPFLPAPPFIPLLVAFALGALSLRNRGASVTVLYVLVFLAVLWQMIGFGLFQLLTAGVGVGVILALVLPLLAFTSKRVELTAMPLAVLCVSLMFTPAYFVSIPIIAAAATVAGFASLGAISAAFILFLVPFLLLNYALPSQASTPVIFEQLTHLSENFKPALSGLTLNAFPPGYGELSTAVSSRLTAASLEVLIIPLLLMSVAILAASFVGEGVRSFLKRIAAARESQKLERIFIPITVSLVVPAAFVAFLVPFSLPGAGDFQTSLSGSGSDLVIALMLVASVVLGGAFVARESLVERMEGSELGREKVERLVRESRSVIEGVKAQLNAVASKVPSLNIESERMALAEYSSYFDDVERQFKDAGVESLVQWTGHIDKVILPSLGKSRDRLITGVLNELRTLSVVAVTVNDHLAEAAVPQRYTLIPDVAPSATMGEIVEAYENATSRIEKETLNLFEAYRSAFEAFNRLVELREASIPVSPEALLGSHDYVTAMRLVAEEYWLNFHIRYSEVLDSKKNLFAQQLGRLREFLSTEQANQLAGIIESVEKAVPAGSVVLLSKVEETRALLESIVGALEDYPRTIERALNSIGPKAAKVIPFQTQGRMSGVLSLRKDLDSAGVGLDSLTKFVASAVPTLAGLTGSWGTEQENLRLLAHYPIARNTIERMLAERKSVRLENLPYERRTALLYARLYVSENPKSNFNEKEEVLTSGA